ncbi:MAG: hypothetical protein JXR10_05890 [Cyclobacteriaceae bacterium]
MNQSNKLAIILGLMLTLSCAEEETSPTQIPGLFENGVFISNEGNFGDADGSISFIHENGTVQNNLFKSVNNIVLGDVVQSLHRTGDHLFAVVNNSNKVEVMTLDSLKSSYTMTDVALPRYMDSDENTGYLTEWVSFTDSGRVTLFDLSTGTISSSIKTGFGTEGVLLIEDMLFVTNSFSSELVIIDLSTEQIVKSLEVGNSPKLMVTDKDGHLWIGCAGGYDSDFQPLGDGALVEIDVENLSILSTVNIGSNFSGKIASNLIGEEIYFTVGNEVKALDMVTNQIKTKVTQSDVTSFYGIGVDEDGNLYASDAQGFEGNGKVYVYSTDGMLKYSAAVGRGPNGFAFN